jgi:hypothetical protein
MTERFCFKSEHGYLVAWRYLIKQQLTFTYSRSAQTVSVCSDDMDKWDYRDTTEFLGMLLADDRRRVA